MIEHAEQIIPFVRPRFHLIGGQLRKLHQSLCNPVEQKTNITFVGDSITWGATLADNGVALPRNGTLSSARDNYVSGSFVNQFKRYVGKTYFNSTIPILSNWSHSSSGESTATFLRTDFLYPGLFPFSSPVISGLGSVNEAKSEGTLLGYRYMMGIKDVNSHIDISFPFTGDKFSVVFTSITSTADYEIFVDGVSIGVFKSDVGVIANRQRREHSFSYVRDKTVTIRAKLPSSASDGDYLNLEAIEIEKEVSIINQGIYGSECFHYAANNFGVAGPSVVTPDMNYVFIQLGTNDRGPKFIEYDQPNGVSNFRRNLTNMVSLLNPHARVILMNANPVENEDPASHSFGMRAVRDTVFDVGNSLGLDVIDNFSIFNGLSTAVFTEDGGHPNLLGHTMIAANIIAALEQA